MTGEKIKFCHFFQQYRARMCSTYSGDGAQIPFAGNTGGTCLVLPLTSNNGIPCVWKEQFVWVNTSANHNLALLCTGEQRCVQGSAVVRITLKLTRAPEIIWVGFGPCFCAFDINFGEELKKNVTGRWSNYW